MLLSFTRLFFGSVGFRSVGGFGGDHRLINLREAVGCDTIVFAIIVDKCFYDNGIFIFRILCMRSEDGGNSVCKLLIVFLFLNIILYAIIEILVEILYI